MIDYIRGVIEKVEVNQLVISCAGIGYRLICSTSCISSLNENPNEAKVYTYLSVTDSGIALYGFYDESERDTFFKLTGVPKVGPKLALAVLSVYSPYEIALLISSGDSKGLSAVSGVGKKLAETIIVSLKDKFDSEQTYLPSEKSLPKQTLICSEAVSALVALGFERSSSYEAVKNIYENDMSEEELIRLSLKSLAK